ncbi:MAG: hypothetical protein LQ345_002796 [Seirophora villosa]|nr:MAG: hypothetical protein LQ345_002796 [Seirophora villosa]
MDGGEEGAEQQLFSQITFHIVSSESLKLSDAETLHKLLIDNGAQHCSPQPSTGKTSLDDVTHVISATSDFPEYDAAINALKSVVKPEWVTASIAKGRRANPRSYSPDPRLFFSGLVLCCADIPEGDKDAVMGGVLATGGLYSSSVTKMVTHIVALTMDHDKCQTVLKKDLKCKIVLPHWFDDCLRIGKRLDEDPYLLPDPEILRGKTHDPIIDTKKVDLQGATSVQPPEPPRVGTRQIDIFKGKKIMLNNDLKISSHLRGTLEDLIDQGGGSTTGSVHKADVLICHYRETAEYRTASRAGKEVGNLTWLYYLTTHNTWTSPMRRLLHYPISQYGLPGFDKFRISLSNYNGEARVYLENLAIAAGGEFTKTMKEDNTHLITAHQHSEKCDAAREWNIDMVNHLWLEDSYAKWQIQTLSNPRYTYFPPRTNLSGIVGQTQIDRHAVERHFFPPNSIEESESTETRQLNARRLQQLDQHNAALPISSSGFMPYRTQDENETPRASKMHKANGPLRTPAASRIVLGGRDGETPSTSSSRGAKDRAAAKLHDQAADIALYEKERKRVGGVIFGGRRKISEDTGSNEGRKRSSSRDEGAGTDEDTRDAKRAKKSRQPAVMRLLSTGYQWAPGKKEAEDKSRLREFGILVTQDPTHCTHLAAPNLLRTRKFICALAYAPMVISSDYIDDCLAKEKRLEPEDYLLKDSDGEQRHGFQLNDSLSRAKNHRGRLLRGMTIYCTEAIKGGFDTYKAIIESNGGKCLLYKGRSGSVTASRAAGQEEDPNGTVENGAKHLYLVSGTTPAEVALWSKFRSMVQGAGLVPRIAETDWLLNVALRQELHWSDRCELKEEYVSEVKNGQ